MYIFVRFTQIYTVHGEEFGICIARKMYNYIHHFHTHLQVTTFITRKCSYSIGVNRTMKLKSELVGKPCTSSFNICLEDNCKK